MERMFLTATIPAELKKRLNLHLIQKYGHLRNEFSKAVEEGIELYLEKEEKEEEK